MNKDNAKAENRIRKVKDSSDSAFYGKNIIPDYESMI